MLCLPFTLSPLLTKHMDRSGRFNLGLGLLRSGAIAHSDIYSCSSEADRHH